MKAVLDKNIGQLIFKAIAFAMSVAVILLNILGAAEPETSITLLAIAIFCLAILQFQKA